MISRRRAPKPKAGRPSLGANGLSRGLTIKVSDTLYTQIAIAATRERVGIGEWLRAAAELAIARGSTR